ncbi:hypothetical protein [Flavimarina sp. Hel_I_48]|uniref:hypothetical protein n=1 Tax=Flavimarina sp. Hel_I_48 TaxID=1392488 RepID=UPI0004DF1AA7|nr:hypothetical protein [Flavimarina sp. Hel_I_48]
MKIFIYILMALATALLIFNLTKVDYSDPLAGNSEVAIISVLACLCALVLLLILTVSRKIANKK